MSYYLGDYYSGDFFGAIGRQVKRSLRDVGRVARAAAPLVAIAVPGLGGIGMVAKAGALASKVRRARGVIDSVRGVLSTGVAPNPTMTPAAQMTELTGRTVGTPVLRDTPGERVMTRENNRIWAQGGYRFDAAGRPIDADDREIPTEMVRQPRSQGSRIAARSKRRAYRRRKATTRRKRSTSRRRPRNRR